MKSVIFLPVALRAVLCVVLLSAYQGKAEEGPAEVYSGQDTTGGVVVETDPYTITIREPNGKQRTFMWFDDSNGRTQVKVNGRATKFKDIKVGMRVQIKFYSKSDGTKFNAKEDAFPIISVNATTSARK